MASIAISKIMPSGKFIIAMYMVDLFYLGLKNTFYNFNLDKDEYNDFIEKLQSNQGQESCDISLAHNIIYGAIDFAEDLDIKPHKDFKITEHFLNADLITDGIDEIEFGKDGKPLYIQGPNDF